MPVKLEEIVAAVRSRLVEAKSTANMAGLETRAAAHSPRGFRCALVEAARTRVAVIAELKKASPSRGLIRSPFHVAGIANQLETAGAVALSVLTEEDYFQGSLANLCEASAATDMPCLRKDFIVDEFQLLEARANRADAVLLIVAALSQAELIRLSVRARELQLDVLCETHDAEEVQRACDAGADIIGVNSRNLRTMSVDLRTFTDLVAKLPANALRVAESGIRNAEDLQRLRDDGYQAFLIGEQLMSAEMPGDELKKLISATGAAGASR
ncbi:MAG TPA: indole-3-glycerol phosphate synthase TrpC [Clostridia bacterium]|nr:indole-3-glycerol phosphate synthase TrpC [Clostridia bacterium]